MWYKLGTQAHKKKCVLHLSLSHPALNEPGFLCPDVVNLAPSHSQLQLQGAFLLICDDYFIRSQVMLHWKKPQLWGKHDWLKRTAGSLSCLHSSAKPKAPLSAPLSISEQTAPSSGSLWNSCKIISYQGRKKNSIWQLSRRVSHKVANLHGMKMKHYIRRRAICFIQARLPFITLCEVGGLF